MTNRGPYDTLRDKSADGKYTAGSKGYNFETQDDEAPGTNEEWMKKHKDHYKNRPLESEGALEDRIYSPLFQKVAEKIFLGFHILRNRNGDSNHVPFLMKANAYYDRRLGIDFIFGAKDDSGRVKEPVITTDLKVVDTFGENNANSENPDISLNLWKITPDGRVLPGSFMNKNHMNKFFTYLCPISTRSKYEIMTNGLGYDDAGITGVNMIHVASDDLHTFVQDRIMSNDRFNQVVELFKSDPKRYARKDQAVEIPVLGSKFKAKDEDVWHIRTSLPFSTFERRGGIHSFTKKIPLQ